jgi:hypothetical protein
LDIRNKAKRIKKLQAQRNKLKSWV